MPEAGEIRDWYERKTDSILAKYGPGPRVHFHIGLVPMDVSLPDAREPDLLRSVLTGSQEALLAHAADVWDGATRLGGDVLDVGCGLGGPAIYWAQRFGGRVTGLTLAPGHAALMESFASRAGVSERVRAMVSDAATWSTDTRFDTAVACESACYLQRDAWFQNLSRLVRPGGHVLVEDTFLGHPEAAAPFDAYWKTRVGTAREYVDTAARAGFHLEDDVDLTDGTTGFWRVSLAWIDATLQTRSSVKEEAERARLRRSREWHGRFLEMWIAHAIEVRLLRFRHEG